MKNRKIVRLAKKKEQEDWINCPFCTDRRKIPIDPDWIEQHLIVVLDKSFHTHVHGPIGDQELMKRFIFKIAKEAGIDIEDEGGEKKEDEPKVVESRRLESKKQPKTRKKGRALKEKNNEDSVCQEEKDSTYQIIPDETA